MPLAYYHSPIGWIEIAGTESAITALDFIEQPPPQVENHPYLQECIHQLEQYFRHERQIFDLDLQPSGTPFQQRVWQQLLTIPYGQTTSYQEVANQLQNPQAIRAVGTANGQNRIAIVIPCHRVIGRDGKLVGYGGGLWRKEWLLKHEGALLL